MQIPRTAQSRRERTYARLVRRVSDHFSGLAFTGKLFRTGAEIDESELWPDDEYPVTPLVIEFAGRDRVGWGHDRSSWLFVLWRYEGGEFREIARTSSVGAEWVEYFREIVRLEIGRRPIAPGEVAARVSMRVLASLDGELDPLDGEERRLALSLLYDQFTARLAECA